MARDFKISRFYAFLIFLRCKGTKNQSIKCKFTLFFNEFYNNQHFIRIFLHFGIIPLNHGLSIYYNVVLISKLHFSEQTISIKNTFYKTNIIFLCYICNWI